MGAPNSPPIQGANEWALEEPLNVALSPSEGRVVLCSTEARQSEARGGVIIVYCPLSSCC